MKLRVGLFVFSIVVSTAGAREGRRAPSPFVASPVPSFQGYTCPFGYQLYNNGYCFPVPIKPTAPVADQSSVPAPAASPGATPAVPARENAEPKPVQVSKYEYVRRDAQGNYCVLAPSGCQNIYLDRNGCFYRSWPGQSRDYFLELSERDRAQILKDFEQQETISSAKTNFVTAEKARLEALTALASKESDKQKSELASLLATSDPMEKALATYLLKTLDQFGDLPSLQDRVMRFKSCVRAITDYHDSVGAAACANEFSLAQFPTPAAQEWKSAEAWNAVVLGLYRAKRLLEQEESRYRCAYRGYDPSVRPEFLSEVVAQSDQ